MFNRQTARVRFVTALLVFALCSGALPSLRSQAADTVTLSFYHWKGADNGPAIASIIKKFEAANPTIKIDFESASTDQYQQVLPTRLAAGDAPDVFGIFPGKSSEALVKAGYVADLSNEAWVSRLTGGAKQIMTYDGKLRALPLDQNVIGVVYNKQIFKDAGVTAVPTTWEEFNAACEKIKAKGITPLALGIKDQWVTQLIPYTMVTTAIYRDTLDFDTQVSAGKASFAKSSWTSLMADYLALNDKGYFNSGALGTTYDQTVVNMATGKAAMVVNGNWIIQPILKAGPDLKLGMFALPYRKTGDTKPVWVPGAVGATITVSASTKYPNEARKFLAFWAQPDISKEWLKSAGAFPVLSDVTPDLDPVSAEILPALNAGSYPFPDQNWPKGVQDVMLKDIQGVFSKQLTIDQMLAEMDKTWAEQSKAAAAATATK